MQHSILAGIMCFLNQFVGLDFETTGLFPLGKDRIIEVGAVKLEEGLETSHFQSLVNPMRRLTNSVTKLTGINNQELENAPLECEVITRLLDYIGDWPIIAHNSAFEQTFLTQALLRGGLPPLTNQLYCSLKAARTVLPGLGSYRLKDLAVFLGLKGEPEFHRALNDARVAASLFLYLQNLRPMANSGKKKKGKNIF